MIRIQTYVEPPVSEWAALTRRPADGSFAETERVRSILDAVRSEGDAALLRFEAEFDGFCADSAAELAVSEAERNEAARCVPQALKDAIGVASSNIRKFHAAQQVSPLRIETAPGIICWQKSVPIRRVGLYVPGGAAPLFSTVLMLAIPAQVAGCKDVVMCTPPGKDGKAAPAVVYAATCCGVGKIFKVGGAQAIAAMAFGTGSIGKRDKIFGPGNRYVTLAKQMIGYTDAAIDMPAGPSEVMVLADETADPDFVAADFLSQAEHGPDSQSVLVCTSTRIAQDVEAAIGRQFQALRRAETVRSSLAASRILVFREKEKIVRFAEAYAPEHLIIAMEDARDIADGIQTAGSVFLGNFSPESAGDYASGTNHTLPTGGWAKSFSGLNVDAYMRKMTIQELSRAGLQGISGTVREMALAEGLDAHAAAVEARLKKN